MTAIAPSEVEARQSSRVRLDYLDGLRGLAALNVMLVHAFWRVDSDHQGGVFSPFVHGAGQMLSFGFYTVIVFIVLSGFCLMLPVAASAQENLRGGIGSYLYRRCRRILPPYYAALLGSIILVAAVPALHDAASVENGTAIQMTKSAVTAHILLVHNLQSDWVTKINPPMWSIAVEWQIYFLFPILIVIWRQWGIIATVCAATALGLVMHRVFSGRYDYWQTFFVGNFALGMAGAAVVFSKRRWMQWARERVPWRMLAAAALAVTAVLMNVWTVWSNGHGYIIGWLLALATAAVLTHCAINCKASHEQASVIRRVLEIPALVAVGGFSYSLYLLHDPLLASAQVALRPFSLPAGYRLLATLLIAAPLCIIVSYGFHIIFERPFMSSPPDHRPRPAPSVAGAM